MLTTLLLVLAAFLLLYAFAHNLAAFYLKFQSHLYNRRYQQIISKAATCVQLVNIIDKLNPSLWDSKNLLPLQEDFQTALHDSLDILIETPPFGFLPKKIDSLDNLFSDLLKTSYELFKTCKESIEESLELNDMDTKVFSGCYFCSRPYHPPSFSLITGKIYGVVLKVLACKWCEIEVKTTGNTKILKFSVRGLEIHWAQNPNYIPGEDYWKISNTPGLFSKGLFRASLKLVEFDSSDE